MKSNLAWFAHYRNRVQYEVSRRITRSIDLCAGIRTEFCKTPEAKDASSDILSQAKRYQPTSYRLAFRSLRWCYKHFPEHAVLDLGCGAGRVLVVAAFVGYRDINGLELDSQLSSQACDNVSRFLRRFHLRRSLSIINASVTEQHIDNKSWLIYLYNPFGEGILRSFLQNNEIAILSSDCVFVYVNPIHEHCLNALGYKTIKSWEVSDFSRTTRVYRHEKYC